MNKGMKRWMLVATALLLIGGLLFVGVMTMAKWDFSKISTTKYETREHKVDVAYEDISVLTKTAKVTLLPSENGETRVVCYEQSKVSHAVSVVDGRLTVSVEDERRWYDHLSFFSFGAPSVKVYLPEGVYGDLSVSGATGEVTLPSGFSFETVSVSVSTGDVTCRASVLGDITLKTGTGDICVENVTASAMDLSVSTGRVTVNRASCRGDVTLTVSTGKATLRDVSCKSLVSAGSTGDLRLENVIAEEGFSLTRSTGDITFDECDAAELFVKTDTGDVTGSLLSEKVFFVSTDTGKKDVPETVTGGKCKITTDTGDIKITIAP